MRPLALRCPGQPPLARGILRGRQVVLVGQMEARRSLPSNARGLARTAEQRPASRCDPDDLAKTELAQTSQTFQRIPPPSPGAGPSSAPLPPLAEVPPLPRQHGHHITRGRGLADPHRQPRLCHRPSCSNASAHQGIASAGPGRIAVLDPCSACRAISQQEVPQGGCVCEGCCSCEKRRSTAISCIILGSSPSSCGWSCLRGRSCVTDGQTPAQRASSR